MPTNSETNDPLIGRQLGDYKIIGKLAAGGMALIYDGIDQKLERHAAIKVLDREESDDQTLSQRFTREARAVAALEHENIVSIYQFGEADDLYFLAMRLIKGNNLAQELGTLRKAGERIQVERALDILEQVASALDYAHDAKIIHRDIKPSNILLAEDGKAFLTDFGLVLRMRTGDETLGTAFGTPRYISPEQALSSDKAVAQSDIYSLAIIAYEMLTGDAPFKGDFPMEIALAHINEPPPSPRELNPDIPEAAERVLFKALEKDPENRHKTATKFVTALKRAYHPEAAKAVAKTVGDSDDSLPTLPIPPEVLGLEQEPQDDVPGVPAPILEETPVEAPARSRSRLRRVLLLVLLAAAVAGVFAVTVVGGGDFGTVVEPESQFLFGAPVTLLYGENDFAIINEGDYDLAVQDLFFVRGVDDGADDYSGDRIPRDSLPPGACFRILLSGTQSGAPPQCSALQGIEQLFDSARFFWRLEPENLASFEVRFAGDVIARCDTVARGAAGECRFNWPVGP